jgi:hypothetical protein
MKQIHWKIFIIYETIITKAKQNDFSKLDGGMNISRSIVSHVHILIY